MRYFWLIPAAILDFVQLMLMLSFLALQFGGTAIGGVLGGFFGIAAATVFGSALSGVGAALDVALSISVGGALIIGLAMSRMFYVDIFLSRALFEVLPFLNVLPFWSNLVWKSIKRAEQAETGAQAHTLRQTFGFITSGGLATGAFAAARQRFPTTSPSSTPQQNQQSSRVPLTNRFADIKPAAKGAALAIMLMVGISAHAQVVPPIQYVVSPESPGARQTVTIEAQGVGSFLGSADITWTQDGAVTKEGIGERSYTFTTKGLGERTVIGVSINSSQGLFSRTFTFNPSRINLVWEADTTVPLLYKGKALYSGGSHYKVVALPTVYSGSSRVAASALSYQWSYRGDPIPEASGLGRNTLSRTGDQLQSSEDIGLEVYYGGSKVGQTGLVIPATDPFIVLYQRDPLRGELLDAALPAGIALAAKEITLQAEPFYFSKATKKAGLIPFAWTINDEETSGPDSARGIITLRQAGSGTGSATLGVSMQNNNPDQFVQAAQTLLRIEFGAQQGSIIDFFGL
jgi:hypothetical protein